MAVEVTYPHIVKAQGQPACMEKHPRTRISMIAADYLWRGWSAEEIARQYSYLTLAEIHAALAYYFDNRAEIESELLEEYRASEQWKHAHPTSPSLLSLKLASEKAAR